MGFATGMRGASTSQQGAFLTPGRFKLKINRCVYRGTQNSGDVYLTETTVLESSDPVKHPVGASRTWMQGTKNKNVFLSACKAFLYAALGYDERNEAHAKTIQEKVEPECEKLMEATCDKGIVNGRDVYVDVTEKPKKTKPGETFNLHVFSPANPPIG